MPIDTYSIGAQSGEVGRSNRQIAAGIVFHGRQHHMPSRVGPIAGSGTCVAVQSLAVGGDLRLQLKGTGCQIKKWSDLRYSGGGERCGKSGYPCRLGQGISFRIPVQSPTRLKTDHGSRPVDAHSQLPFQFLAGGCLSSVAAQSVHREQIVFFFNDTLADSQVQGVQARLFVQGFQTLCPGVLAQIIRYGIRQDILGLSNLDIGRKRFKHRHGLSVDINEMHFTVTYNQFTNRRRISRFEGFIDRYIAESDWNTLSVRRIERQICRPHTIHAEPADTAVRP